MDNFKGGYVYINLDLPKPDHIPPEVWDKLHVMCRDILHEEKLLLSWHEIRRNGWYEYECPYCHIHHAFATEICPYCGRPLDNSNCTMV